MLPHFYPYNALPIRHGLKGLTTCNTTRKIDIYVGNKPIMSELSYFRRKFPSKISASEIILSVSPSKLIITNEIISDRNFLRNN